MDAHRIQAPSGRSLLRRLAAEAWEAVLPQRCLVCGGFGAALHEDCVARLPAADGVRCERCWRPGIRPEPPRYCERCAAGGVEAPAFEGLRAPFRFEGPARRALLEAKFRGVSALLPPLARAAADLVPAEWRPDLVVPVPLGTRRERSRGFNQARVAAEAVAERLSLPLGDRLVRRVRETRPQATLDAEARRTNLGAAFELTASPPPWVLLVDDVTTTGTTLSVLAGILRAGGAEHVYAIAMARED